MKCCTVKWFSGRPESHGCNHVANNYQSNLTFWVNYLLSLDSQTCQNSLPGSGLWETCLPLQNDSPPKQYLKHSEADSLHLQIVALFVKQTWKQGQCCWQSRNPTISGAFGMSFETQLSPRPTKRRSKWATSKAKGQKIRALQVVIFEL